MFRLCPRRAAGIAVGALCAATSILLPARVSALDFDFLIRDLGVSGYIQGLSETSGLAYSQPTRVVLQSAGTTQAPLGEYGRENLDPCFNATNCLVVSNAFIVSNGAISTYNWRGFSSNNAFILDFFFLGAALYEPGDDPALRDYRHVEFSLRSPSVPGPLPLLGVGAAFGFSRKLRTRLSISKLPCTRSIH
jgi:hypothetical protein